jgi:hypothetical protein
VTYYSPLYSGRGIEPTAAARRRRALNSQTHNTTRVQRRPRQWHSHMPTLLHLKYVPCSPYSAVVLTGHPPTCRPLRRRPSFSRAARTTRSTGPRPPRHRGTGPQCNTKRWYCIHTKKLHTNNTGLTCKDDGRGREVVSSRGTHRCGSSRCRGTTHGAHFPRDQSKPPPATVSAVDLAYLSTV